MRSLPAASRRTNVYGPSPVGDEFEEGLVDRAEFFGTEVAVVDAPPAVRRLVADPGQRLDRGEQLLVGQLKAGEHRVGGGVVVDAAQARQAEVRQAAFRRRGH